MSHEHIVATVELILKKDDALAGGDLQFERSFTSSEGGGMIMGFPQSRPNSLDELCRKASLLLASCRCRVVVLRHGLTATFTVSPLSRTQRTNQPRGELLCSGLSTPMFASYLQDMWSLRRIRCLGKMLRSIAL